jgi:hypothetical protein
MKKFVALLGFLVVTSMSAFVASGYVHIANVSELQYQIYDGGTVYFRNLNKFDSGVTGCCYAFALDTSTEGGKSMWSTILLKMATGGDIYFYLTERNPPTSGSPAYVHHIGNW